VYDDVGEVSAELIINGKELWPSQITELLGLEPDYAHSIGTPIISIAGRQVDTRKTNHWRRGSGLAASKDLDAHIRALLQVFEPCAAAVRKIAERSNVFVFARWESFGLILGSGPILSAETCRGIHALGAELHLDIYCLREHDLKPVGADGHPWTENEQTQ
jgi:Domain of unknown function (DUF4279)